MKHKLRTLYFIGIGGSGMSGIAEVLLNLGFRVEGSDLQESETTIRLRRLGAVVHIGHHAENVRDVDAVVVSSAVSADNPERTAAAKKGIPIVPRAIMLAEIMRMRQSIAVAGTHGKTTSTSLISAILGEAGLDPTYVIGGLLSASGSNAKLGQGEYMVVEADESDGSFLSLYPIVTMITNIDRDHLENYRHDFIALKKAFIEFTEHIPFYGAVIACLDDEGVRDILPFVSRPIKTYGLSDKAQYRASNIRAQGRTMHFTLHRPMMDDMEMVVNHPGVHSVLNALGAIAVADELGVADHAIAQGLLNFRGVGRRSEEIGTLKLNHGGEVLVVEDYGHHPTEILATVDALRTAYSPRRLVLVFQPHRYSRTRDCFDDFVRVLAREPYLALTDIYPAGEAPITSVSSQALMSAIQHQRPITPQSGEWRHLIGDSSHTPQVIQAHLRDGDVLLVMGAGSVGPTFRQAVNSPAPSIKPTRKES